MSQTEKRPLMILGNGPTMNQGVRIVDEKPMEMWGVNYQTFPALTMLFQMHGDHFVRARYLDHYAAFPPKVPVVMQHRWKAIPTSVEFPMKKYQEYFGLAQSITIEQSYGEEHGQRYKGLTAYHACTMSYMIALAVMMEMYSHIYVYGVDFWSEFRHESTYEKPCVESHIFFGAARGVKFIIPESSRLFTTSDCNRQVYGLEWNPSLTLDEIERNNKIEV